ncbi:PPD, partial [Symbiodinium pilosum]
VTLATVATYPLTRSSSSIFDKKTLSVRAAAQALGSHGRRAVASANPVAAVE